MAVLQLFEESRTSTFQFFGTDAGPVNGSFGVAGTVASPTCVCILIMILFAAKASLYTTKGTASSM